MQFEPGSEEHTQPAIVEVKLTSFVIVVWERRDDGVTRPKRVSIQFPRKPITSIVTPGQSAPQTQPEIIPEIELPGGVKLRPPKGWLWGVLVLFGGLMGALLAMAVYQPIAFELIMKTVLA
jgi:hypothetical protein